jgi:hypothetical protein
MFLYLALVNLLAAITKTYLKRQGYFVINEKLGVFLYVDYRNMFSHTSKEETMMFIKQIIKIKYIVEVEMLFS